MKSFDKLLSNFRQLRWRLTLTYTAVTVGALLVVELIAMLASGSYLINLLDRGYLPPRVIEAAMMDYTPVLRHFLEMEHPDREGIAIWLERFYTSTTLLQGAGEAPVVLDPGEMETLVVDADGILLGVSSPGLAELDIGGQLDPTIFPQAQTVLLQAALSGEIDPENLFAYDDDLNLLFMAVPVQDSGLRRLLGVLVITAKVPNLRTVLGNQFDTIGVSLLVFTLFAGIIGAVFGSLAARGFVRRFDHMAETTRAWSLGDFDTTIDIAARDELGELAGRLNHMAQQLQHLMETRREYAILEERTRLARELHDSAKQQAFAAAGQVNAARTLIKSDPQAAQAHIDEAEILIKNLRRELGNLIRQLRPIELEDKGLAAALRDYAEDWSRQTGISQELQIYRERRLPVGVEQAIFRILQEALSNVARHSHAGGVKMKLEYGEGKITCTLRDDGVGFDPSVEQHGYGLRSMRERLEAFGGVLRIESEIGGGTRITIEIPSGQLGVENGEDRDE